jgi:hypothetical protein
MFPNIIEVSNDSLSPNQIGERNHWLQWRHRIEISVVFDMVLFLLYRCC